MLIGLMGFLYWGFPNIHRVEAPKGKSPKTLATPLELGRLGALELQLQPVRDQSDELTIRRLALGVAHRVAKEALQGVQIAPVPGDLDGVANGTLHSAWRGAEVLGYLGIEHLGDGVACLTARWGLRRLVAFPLGLLLSLSSRISLLYGCDAIIVENEFEVKFQAYKHIKL